MKKRKKRRKNSILPLILRMLLIIIGGILLGLLIYKYIKDTNKQVKGNWVRELDYSDEVNMNLSKWICSATGGNQIDITNYLDKTEINVYLNFYKDNTYEILVDKQSYKDNEDRINKAGAKALEDLIKARFIETGIKGELDINSLFMTAYGIGIEEYVKDYAPSFLPTYADISNGIEESGDYVIEDGMLYMGHGSKEELLNGPGFEYMVGDMLVFTDGNSVNVYHTVSDDSVSEVHAASYAYPFELRGSNLQTGKELNVGAYYIDYSGNVFVSLRDLAVLLGGTDKAYDFAISGDDIVIKNGKEYIPTGGENIEFSEDTKETGYRINSNLVSKSVIFNDQKRRYFLMSAENAEGNKDMFMSMIDISLLMDITLERDGNILNVYPDRSLVLDLEKLQDESEYFEMSRSALVGDITTGDIYYSFKEDEQVPMASTTKLMTYIVVMDAVYNGEISVNDSLIPSQNVIELSMTPDMVIPMEDVESVTFEDALKGMLIGSSNECSLLLAEHVAGSEEEFVDRMNAKAKEIGLSDSTYFYNCNGLPIYSGDTANAKNQNHITAKDMFELCKYLMSLYPEITDITSLESVVLPSFANQELKNTNLILNNVPGMIGLKTGSTAMSGACLVSAAKTDDTEDAHIIVSALFGAESSIVRTQMSEVLMRYGLQTFEGVEAVSSGNNKLDIPDNLEAVIRNLINVARKELAS